MTDPFGAIATQAIGDLGLHIGNGQWAATGHMSMEVPAMIVGPQGSRITSSSSGYVAATTATRLNIYDGSLAHPITVDRPTMTVSRTSKLTFTGQHDEAIAASSLSTTTVAHATNVAVQGMAFQQGQGDSVGVEGSAFIESGASGTGQTAFGLYALVGDYSTTGFVTGCNPVLQVSRDQAYAAGSTGSGGVFVQALGLPGTAAQGFAIPFGVGIYSNTPTNVQFDVGFAAIQGAKSAAFLDDTSAVASVKINGTHTYGIDLSAATNTFEVLFGASEFIDKTGGNLRFGMGPGSGAGHNAIYTYDNTVNQFRFFTGGSGLITAIADGTPGANLTCAYFLEGATPTLRRLTTFNPGAAGINFTNGQLVCVMV